jgi:hypothetical protein
MVRLRFAELSRVFQMAKGSLTNGVHAPHPLPRERERRCKLSMRSFRSRTAVPTSLLPWGEGQDEGRSHRVLCTPLPDDDPMANTASSKLSPVGERIASADRALVVALLEPAHALLRGAMGEGIRHRIPLCTLLDCIVTDG